MSTAEEVKAIWRSADCVCFDVDSTVCTDEAIDELADFLGVGDKVAELTKNAMQGSMTFKESLAARLQLIQPSKSGLENFIDHHPPSLTVRLKDVVDCLHQRSVPIYLISGGFVAIIEKVAEILSISKGNIFANVILHDAEGKYVGFDESQPTCETGGKPKVIQILKDKFSFKNVVHIGDGVTDMEACPPADAFIGFGGNQVREKVKQGSAWFVYDFQELVDELNK